MKNNVSVQFPYEASIGLDAVDIDENKLTKAIDLFKKQYRKGDFPGGQIVIRHCGKLVYSEEIGIACGFNDGEKCDKVAVKRDTLFNIFSASKPILALAIAILEDRGLLDVNAPVADIFPEFARNNKDKITTLDVLTHQSGVFFPEIMDPNNSEQWGNQEKIREIIANAIPTFPRGTLAYQPTEYGFILSEIVSQLTGQSTRDFINSNIFKPAGLPIIDFESNDMKNGKISRSYWTGSKSFSIGEMNIASTYEDTYNSYQLLKTLIPGGLIDASRLAAFYEIFLRGGTAWDGTRIISAETLRKYTTHHISGLDKNVKFHLAYGRGIQVGKSLLPAIGGWFNTKPVFGHISNSAVGFGDYKKDLSVAIITNGAGGLKDVIMRFVPLTGKIRKAFR